MRLRHEKAALVGIGMFQRSERAAARQRAAISAQAELAALWQQAQAAAAQWQAYLDDQWSRLLANDPDIVLATLAEAFEDNEAPAAAIGVDGGELSLIVLIPPASAVPERMPATTRAGNLTLRKLPKGERAQFYGLLAAGHVLVTVRKAFAVARGIQATRVIAVRSEGQDVYGRRLLECIRRDAPRSFGIMESSNQRMAACRFARPCSGHAQPVRRPRGRELVGI